MRGKPGSRPGQVETLALLQLEARSNVRGQRSAAFCGEPSVCAEGLKFSPENVRGPSQSGPEARRNDCLWPPINGMHRGACIQV